MPLRDWGYDKISCTRAWQKDNQACPLASSSLLPLLKTCRRSYSELIEGLYKKNVFCFQDPLTLELFVKTVLPERLNQISTVQLPWKKTFLGFPVPRQQFSEALEKLQHLPNLREIRVLDVGKQSWPKLSFYPHNNLLVNQAVQETDVKIVFDHHVVRDGPTSRPGPKWGSTFRVLNWNKDGIYVPRVD
ncbi:MAG: hypothetical protein Q9221_004952 [Calogaya cf. arnoldii]